MTTLTINIEDKKTEKAIKAVLDAFDLDYNVDKKATLMQRPLNKSEKKIYNSLKKSLEQIKLHQEGKIVLPTIEDLLAELPDAD
jgi:L-fucose mutarotase/ribose pyranase (RbsD/FucU family)